MADVEGRMTRLHRAATGLRRADIAKLLFRNGDDLGLDDDDDDAELPPREDPDGWRLLEANPGRMAELRLPFNWRAKDERNIRMEFEKIGDVYCCTSHPHVSLRLVNTLVAANIYINKPAIEA